MASLTYIKGVRTRFRNSLKEEIQRGNDILLHDQDEIDTDEETVITKVCLNNLKTYREKLENQCGKYIEALAGTENNDEEQIMDDDYILCDDAMTCSYKLDTYLDNLTSQTKGREVRETKHEEQVNALQEKMQSFMTDQSKRQQEFAEWQSQRQLEFHEKQMAEQHELMDRLTAPKEPSTSVKLPKLELRSFNGDKLKWSELWDSFECAFHKTRHREIQLLANKIGR